MSERFTSTLKGAAVLLFSVTIIGRGFGFFREILVANYFGAGTDFEVYLVGAVFPIILNTVIYFISQNYFIPTYNNLKSRGENEHVQFISGSFWTFIVLSTLLAALLYLLSGTIISVYLGAGTGYQFSQAKTIFNILLVTIPLNAGFSVLAGYLNSEFRYAYPAVAQLLWNIGQILILILFYKIFSIYTLPFGLAAGYLIQLLYVYFSCRKQISFTVSLSILKKFRSISSGSFLLFIVIIEFINQLYSFLDRYYYTNVEQGGIAALNYANILFQLPLSIVSLVFVTIMFPKLSEAFSSRNYSALKMYYSKGLLYNLILYVPIILVFFFSGDLIVEIVYERGKFTSPDSIMTFQILQIYSVSLLFYSSYAIISKVIFSTGMVKQLLVISVICLITKIILNALLVEIYQQNGLAFSTSFSLILMSVLGFLAVRFKLKTLS